MDDKKFDYGNFLSVLFNEDNTLIAVADSQSHDIVVFRLDHRIITYSHYDKEFNDIDKFFSDPKLDFCYQFKFINKKKNSRSKQIMIVLEEYLGFSDITIYNVVSRRDIRKVGTNFFMIDSIALSPNADLFAILTNEIDDNNVLWKIIQIFETLNGNSLYTLYKESEDSQFFYNDMKSISFSADGRYIFGHTRYGEIKVWDLDRIDKVKRKVERIKINEEKIKKAEELNKVITESDFLSYFYDRYLRGFDRFKRSPFDKYFNKIIANIDMFVKYLDPYSRYLEDYLFKIFVDFSKAIRQDSSYIIHNEMLQIQ